MPAPNNNPAIYHDSSLRSTFLLSVPVAFHEPSRIPRSYVGNSARYIDEGEKKGKKWKGIKIKTPDHIAIVLNYDVKSEKSGVILSLAVEIKT